MGNENTCIPGFSNVVSLVTGTASCTQCEDNWIEIKATDKDTGEPIPNLPYKIFDTSLEEELASGVLDENGEKRHGIPVENTEVIVLFGTDEAIEKAIEQIENRRTQQALQDNAVSEWRGIPAGLDEHGFNREYDRIVAEDSSYGKLNSSFLDLVLYTYPPLLSQNLASSARDFLLPDYTYNKNRRQNFEEYQIATNARQATDRESFLGGTDQGLSFGFSEEIMAGLDSLLSDRTYEELLEERRQLQRAQHTANSNWYLGGEIAGTVPTIFIPVGGVAATGVRGTATVGRTVLQTTATGAGLGGLSGFGHGEGLEDRLCGALEGAVIGGALSFLLSGAGVLIARSASKAKIWVRISGSTRKSVDDLIENSSSGRPTKGKTEQRIRDGGLEQANRDFDDLWPNEVRDINTKYGPGRSGTLPDGRSVTVRPGSTDGRPTLEIRNPTNNRGYEFRYD